MSTRMRLNHHKFSFVLISNPSAFATFDIYDATLTAVLDAESHTRKADLRYKLRKRAKLVD